MSNIFSSLRGIFLTFIVNANVIVTNFETILTEFDRMNLFLRSRNVAIIIDESTKLKNPEAKLTKAFFELSGLFKIKTIMTGTPVANRPYDIWAQIFFLDEGLHLGRDFSAFKKSTDLSNKLNTDDDMRCDFENSIAEIYDKISDFCVRETKATAGIKLPQKEYVVEKVELSPKQAKLYQNVMTEMQTDLHMRNMLRTCAFTIRKI